MSEIISPPVGSFDGRTSEEAQGPTTKNYPGFGELVVGGGDPLRVMLTAMCMLDNPQVNQFLLDHKLKMSDKLTKTQIFPREGMALPDGKNFSQNS